MGINPWLDPVELPHDEVTGGVDVDEALPPAATGAQWPETEVPVVDAVDRLPRREVPQGSDLWVLGVHGGAGESTLASWLGGREAHHAWPVMPTLPARVLLVARTHAAGLEAARRAVTEWGGSAVPCNVRGLVLIADVPGPLPKLLKAQVRQLSGAVPATWALPYAPLLRFAAQTPPEPPTGLNRALRSIEKATSAAATKG